MSKSKKRSEINKTENFVIFDKNLNKIQRVVYPHTINVGLKDNSHFNATISGSIHHTHEGKSYLIAGNSISITSASNGQVTITSEAAGDITSVVAGSGLTGGATTGDATLNIGAGTGITVNANDITTNDSQIVHDNLSGFVTNEHVDHSSVSITAGSGLTGGGDITSTRTINIGAGTGITVNANDVAIDADGATLTTNNSDIDHILINDGGVFKRIAPSNINISGLNNDSGFTANTGDITGVTAGTGITGGGSSGTVTLNINNSIVATLTGSQFSGNVGITGSLGATTVVTSPAISGSLTHLADGTSYLIAGNNIQIVTGSTGVVTITGTATGDITGVTAGNGLTGGGDSGAVTLTVGAGTGIDVSSEAIAVDVSDFMTNGSNNRVLTATGTDAMNSEANLTFDGSKLDVTGVVEISNDLRIADKMEHLSDADTCLRFPSINKISAEAGGVALLLIDGNSAQKALIINESGQDIDTRFEALSTAGNGTPTHGNVDADHSFFLRGDTGQTGLGVGNMASGFNDTRLAIKGVTTIKDPYSSKTWSQLTGSSDDGRLDLYANNAVTSRINSNGLSLLGGDDSNLPGLLIVRRDATIATDDFLGGVGFDSSDGNVPTTILNASAFIAAYASEAHGTGDKGGYMTFGVSKTNDNDDTASTEFMRLHNDGMLEIKGANPLANNVPEAETRLFINGGGADERTSIIQMNATVESRINFGDEDDDDVGKVAYAHGSNMYFTVETNEAVRFHGSGESVRTDDAIDTAADFFTNGHQYYAHDDSGIQIGDCCVLVDGKIMKSSLPMQKNVAGIAWFNAGSDKENSNWSHIITRGKKTDTPVTVSKTWRDSLNVECDRAILIDEEWSMTDELGSIWKVASVGDSRQPRSSNGEDYLKGFKVCNEGGDIVPGDLLCTSSTPGQLMKQSDDIIRSYTVGKAMGEVTFDSEGKASGVYGYIYCG